MARYRCPGCGKPYDGRKCKSCLYETFTEEVAHGNHWHAGEPLARDTPPSRPSGKPGSCESYGGKRKQVRLPKWLTALVAVLLLNSCSIIAEVLDDLDYGQNSYSYASMQAQPESAPAHLTIPEDAPVLYEGNGILVAADWRPGTPLVGTIPILVQNDTDRTLQVSSGLLSVDGCMTDEVFLYCEAYPNSITQGWLYLEDGLEAAAGVTMILDIFDAEIYDFVGGSGIVTLGETGVIHELDCTGALLFDGDFRLFYQGAEWTDYGSLILEFYGENCTGDILYLYAPELLVNGESTQELLHQDFLPQTRAVIRTEIYDPQLCGLEGLEDLRELEFSLDVLFEGEGFTQYTTEPIVLEVN